MENNNFKELFEQIKQFKDIQEKQKQRGLNNYNIFTTISKNSNENNHSKMIASFLNPSGEHYQSTLFLDKFLEVLNINEFNIKTDSCSVCREYKNIDIYITDGNKHIIIENKIYAKDQHRQIERYINEIRKDNKELEPNDILVIYLSLDREIPTQYSLGDLKIEDNKVKRNSEDIALFKSIHYKKEILDWLENCKYEVQNITNLNEVFRQYIDVVKMITNKYKEKIMNLSDYIVENKDIYKLAIEIEKEFPRARERIIDSFFKKVKDVLIHELGNEWIVEIKGNLSKKWTSPFKIYKKKWNRENTLIFAFEFDKNNYYNGYLGIMRKNKKINIENIVETFQSELNIIKGNKEIITSEWWLHWEYIPNADDFVKYIQLHINAEEDFINRMRNLIEIFEKNNGLITEINNYLNSEK